VPELSIITISYNMENEIAKTIESVLNQGFTDYEYIFIDGKSTDKTVDIIESYREQFESKGINYSVTSEPDKGIYDAMNKGIDKASGEWCIMLNSGDALCSSDTLSNVFSKKKTEADVVYGDTKNIEGKYCRVNKGNNIDLMTLQMPFCHQSSLVRTSIHRQYKFNTEYKISSVYNSFLRMYMDGKKFEYIDEVISLFDCSGVSSTNFWAVRKEYYKIKKANSIKRNPTKEIKKLIMDFLSYNKKLVLKKYKPEAYYTEKKGWELF